MASLGVWIRNTLRNKLKHRPAARALGVAPRPIGKLRVASATRMTAKEFWTKSALGLSLKDLREDPRIDIDVAFENRAGLPAVNNAALRRAAPGDAVLFIHDDIWLDDPQWLEKLLEALATYDVVGVAGNRRRVDKQPAWLYSKVENARFWLDAPNLSGAVAHGPKPRGEVTYFGPAPAHCELLDGLFIAARCDALKPSGVEFDERFLFHFYDLDFCRSARAAGLSVGTWPIELTHQSTGAFSSDGWKEGLALYFGKWQG